MAALDTVKIQKIYTDNGITNLGMEERVSIADFLGLANLSASAIGTATAAITQTAPAAAAVPFADLTAAANAFNSLRTALIAARVLK